MAIKYSTDNTTAIRLLSTSGQKGFVIFSISKDISIILSSLDSIALLCAGFIFEGISMDAGYAVLLDGPYRWLLLKIDAAFPLEENQSLEVLDKLGIGFLNVKGEGVKEVIKMMKDNLSIRWGSNELHPLYPKNEMELFDSITKFLGITEEEKAI